MESKLTFEKNIKFNDKIYEITQIGLDKEYHLDEYTINGNFIVSGKYRNNEICFKDEPFNYKIPFTIELNNNVNLDTTEFIIDDFKYNPVENVLKINIDVIIKYQEIEQELFKEVDDSYRDEFKELLEEQVVIEPPIEQEINNNNNEYIKYIIYFVKPEDSIESICKLYNVTVDIINKYNKKTDLIPGDKLIIPYEG